MQKRAISGKVFEEEIAKKYGKRVSKSPKISWNGIGRTNLDKIVNLNFDENLFYPTENSKFFKHDLVGFDGKFYEIKKYITLDLNSWKLYSEPILKISTKSALESVIKKFGGGDLQKAQTIYNDFIHRLFKKLTDDGTLEKIKNEMIKNITGMFIMDDYKKIEELEFRWVIIDSAWKGFNRITLQFKLK